MTGYDSQQQSVRTPSIVPGDATTRSDVSLISRDATVPPLPAGQSVPAPLDVQDDNHTWVIML